MNGAGVRLFDFTLIFGNFIFKKLNVREAESIARHIAVERARKLIDQELIDIEDLFKEKLGARVRIEKKEEGGRITIDFFNKDDLRALLERIVVDGKVNQSQTEISVDNVAPLTEEEKILAEDELKREGDDESLYSITNFSI